LLEGSLLESFFFIKFSIFPHIPFLGRKKQQEEIWN